LLSGIIFAWFSNIEQIEQIGPPGFKIFGWDIPLNSPGGLWGSIITWKKVNVLNVIYIVITRILNFVAGFFFVSLFLLMIYGLLSKL